MFVIFTYLLDGGGLRRLLKAYSHVILSHQRQNLTAAKLFLIESVGVFPRHVHRYARRHVTI